MNIPGCIKNGIVADIQAIGRFCHAIPKQAAGSYGYSSKFLVRNALLVKRRFDNIIYALFVNQRI